MKYVISMTALLMLLGSTVATYARQEKGQEGHSEGGHAQAAKPAEQHAKPAEPHTQQAKPAATQHTEAAQTRSQAKPAAQEHASTASHAQQNHAATNQSHAAQSHAAASNRGGDGGGHGRIDNAHYSRSFGSGHSFHVNRGDYDRHRFAYGGYNFGFGAPWPVGWGYDDDVYVVYTDGGYYMYDRVHPGLRLSINIL
jgi:hypothetical protein